MKANYISYSDAVKRFNNSIILCNNITEVDSAMWDNSFGNFFDENDNMIDFYQFYITDCTMADVDYLVKWYDLKFLYSELLECFILCVDHYGTNWRGVMIEDKSPRR